MNCRLKKLLCFILIACITACASLPAYEVAMSSPSETYSVLSRNISSDDKIRVHLRDGTVIIMIAIRVTPETLNGRVAGALEVQKIRMEDIVRVETNLDNESTKKVGKLLLGVLLMVGITVLVVGSSGGGYNFGGVGFGSSS
jgi:flagellar basal body-associated protein FliL